jgi:hypothetical protein
MTVKLYGVRSRVFVGRGGGAVRGGEEAKRRWSSKRR